MSRYSIDVVADDGERYSRPLPDDWGQVPLLPYCHLAGAQTLPARIEALAGLLDVPTQPLLDNVGQYARLLELLPWLLAGPPPAGEPVAKFKHAGVRYVSQGHLRTLTAGQLEALYTMQAAYREQPLLAAPGLLAVLYAPAGQLLTPELHQASTAAFASLPVSVAWPALLDFTASSASAALDIASYSALRAQASELVASLEAALSASASTPFWQKLPRFLLRRWLQSVKAMATMP